MKIIINNRLNGLADETIENIDINLTTLIVALWKTPETQRSKFSSFIHKSKPLDADKIQDMLVLNQYANLKSIDTKKIYARRLHSVALKSNLNWEVLQIDETSYLKHRAKNPAFLPNLIKQHAKTKSTLSAPPIPAFMMEAPLSTKKLRPREEINPAYPIPPVPSSDPAIESSTSTTPTMPKATKTPPQNPKKNTKKIILLSLILGVGVGVALTLFNLSLIASILYASLASTTIFIIAKNAPNTSSKPPFPSTPLCEQEDEGDEKEEEKKPVNPLLTPKNTAEKADKKMPPKPILSVKELSKKPSTVFESSEDSEDSEESEDIAPKRAAKHR